MNIQKIKIEDIKIIGDNPRKLSDENRIALRKYIEKYGPLSPLIIDTKNRLIGGHSRLEVLKELNYQEVECNIVDPKNEFERKEIQLLDNQAFGEWVKNKLLAFIEGVDLDLGDFHISLDEIKLADLSFKDKEGDAEEDEYEMPEEVKTDIKEGDIFDIKKDGKIWHKLICGDSTKKETYEKLLEGQQADLVLTDPPYNVNYEGGTGLKIKNDSQTDQEFYKFLLDFYTFCATHTKDGGAWYIWHASSEAVNFGKAMIEAGISLKQCLIWVKSSLVMGRQDYQWMHEPCYYGWKEGAKHSWYGDRKQTTILSFDKPKKNAEHPTMKPVLLFAHLINNSSKAGDIVIDPFGGSGTTMVACHQLARRAFLIEYDPKYCQVILDRMKALDKNIEIIKHEDVKS